MMYWTRIVRCPSCGYKKEVSMTQNKWKCNGCGKKFEVKDTIFRQLKKEGTG